MNLSRYNNQRGIKMYEVTYTSNGNIGTATFSKHESAALFMLAVVESGDVVIYYKKL